MVTVVLIGLRHQRRLYWTYKHELCVLDFTSCRTADVVSRLQMLWTSFAKARLRSVAHVRHYEQQRSEDLQFQTALPCCRTAEGVERTQPALPALALPCELATQD